MARNQRFDLVDKPTLRASSGKLYCTDHGHRGRMQPHQPKSGEKCCVCQDNMIRARNANRGSVCAGCHNNYYNHPTGGDGWNAPVPENYGCWSLSEIRRGKCPSYHR